MKTLYIEPGSPWENGYNESFNSKLRDELLNMEIYMDASRLQGMIWCVRTTGCSSISGLFVQDFCLLAPMEFADPRLILLKGFSPNSPCRLSGSRSDLFAITRCRTLRNLLTCHLLCQSLLSIASRA